MDEAIIQWLFAERQHLADVASGGAWFDDGRYLEGGRHLDEGRRLC